MRELQPLASVNYDVVHHMGSAVTDLLAFIVAISVLVAVHEFGHYIVGRWTGMKVLKHDGSQHHLIGIQPKHPVTRTLRAVRESRDEMLMKAREVVSK